MNDKIFLKWIYERLVHVYMENPDVDYMCRLRAIIANTPKKRLSAISTTKSIGKLDDFKNLRHELIHRIKKSSFISELEDHRDVEYNRERIDAILDIVFGKVE